MTARSSFDQDIFIDTEELEGFATFSNKSNGIYCQVYHAKNKLTGEYVYLKVKTCHAGIYFTGVTAYISLTKTFG